MILDSQLIFSDAQAVTTAQATPSTNVIDLGAAGDTYNALWFVANVHTTVTSGGAATVQFELQTDDNASFSSPKTLWQSGAIGKATLVAGYNIAKLRLPKGCERYLRVVITPAVADLTAGKFTAFLAYDV